MQKINDLRSKIAKHQDLIRTATERVIASGHFILGPELNHFEELFATYLGVNHCVGVANGTDAIEIALKALDVKAGDLVATVANAGMYASIAILALGAQPLFMDVSLETKNTTLSEVKSAIKAGANAIIVTHLYGLAIPEILEIAQYCAEQKIPLLEDCAQAHGATIHARRVGGFGNAASFSFYPTKNLGALGDAGAVVTNNASTAAKVKLLRQYGWTEKYRVETLAGRNSRLDEIQAAILSELLPHLDEDNARRREIAQSYTSNFHSNELIPALDAGSDYVAHLYVIRTQHREALQAHLFKNNILSDIHYPIPDYAQPVFKNRFEHINLKSTEQLAREILTLPCYPEMTDAEIEHVIRSINSFTL